MNPSKMQPYGAWESPLTAAKLASDSAVGLGQLRSNGDALFWIESRAHENGRCVIVRHNKMGTVDLTPPTYSVVSRVHEYGGAAYCVSDDTVYFINADDQNLYAQSLTNPKSVQKITRSTVSERFADPIYDRNEHRLICIRECHAKDQEAINDLVAIQIPSGAIDTLHQGHDFYAHARLAPNGKRLAFLAWDHPNMPWNGTQLYVLELGISIGSASIVTGGQEESICQPEWLNEEELVYCSDRSGFYNLYLHNDTGSTAIAPDEREYGHAMWQLGSTQYVTLTDKILLAAPNHNELTLVDTFTGMLTPVEEGAVAYRDITPHRMGFAFIQSFDNKPDTLCVRETFNDATKIVTVAGPSPIATEYVSRAESIAYPGSHGEEVYAYFYRPHNPHFIPDATERPPLLVQAHGGPTSSTSAAFRANVQFYTSRGWAVLDVNYSGSTGYGRAYRDRLLHEWGNRDVEDLAAGVRYLIAQDLIDPQRVAIAGGSAGGYTVLRALTVTNVFKVGASRYGIADLRTLADDTHKFESRYIEQLVPLDAIDERSPINHVEKLNCPVIFTQGTEDKVVPPSQARMMFDALRTKGIPTALFMFEGEYHGFRKLETRIKCLEAEYFFFSRVFKFDPYSIDATALEGAESAHLDCM